MRPTQLALLFSAICLPACGGWLGPSKSARADLFECRVEALKPIAGEVYDVEQAVREIYAGRLSLAAVAASVQATQAEVATLVAALKACEQPAVDAPASAPSEVEQ
jgi:hypothetical protein